MKCNYWYSLMMLVIFVSCNRTKSPEEIYKENAQGVVMVVNQYYYKVTLPNENVLYFPGFDEDGDPEDLFSSLEEMENKKSLVTGTGFFISADGKILTNRHVVQPELKDKNVKNFFHNVKDLLKLVYQYQIVEYKDKIDSLSYEMRQCLFIDSEGDYCYRLGYRDRYERLDKEQDEIIELRNEAKENLEAVESLDMDDILVEPVCEYGIAYNDTHITKFSDLSECVLLSISDVETIDLATLQLKNHITPEYIRVPQLYDKEDEQDLVVGEELHMIGYNAGFLVSNTAQGIKSQIYSGALTQNSDGNKILYSISALQGSSGSPVFDNYGYLVAVNFAGFTSTQNFNYGIPSKKIRRYLEKE